MITPARPSALAVSPDKSINVMIVDDSAVIRGLIARNLQAHPSIRIVASAANGQFALDYARKGGIDVVILDIEMPVMDGLTALPRLLALDPRLKIIVASTLSTRNAEISLKCLDLGAVDYIPKPTASRDVGALAGGSDAFRRELIDKILVHGGQRRGFLPMATSPRPPFGTSAPAAAATSKPSEPHIRLRPPSALRPRVLAIGCSTGGPQALKVLLPGLVNGGLALPIVITQHMPPTFTSILADHIRLQTGRTAAEAKDGEELLPHQIYVAPGGRHLRVIAENGRCVVRLGNDPPQNFCRPAVDPMFLSLAEVFGARVLATVLTGMGNDGRKGAEAIVSAGGTVVAQDEASSVVWGMPGAVATAGLCAAVEPISKLAETLLSLASRGQS